MAGKAPPDGEALRLHLLVLRSQSGDEGAFAQLMAWFGARTLRYLRGLLGDDGDDVQQEVWLTVYRRIGGLTNPSAFRSWLYRTTRHRAIDFLRARKQERALLVEPDPSGGEPAAPDDDGEGLDLEAVGRAMAQLTPLHREVLLLRYREEMSYAEIAVLAGCSIGTVRSRLHHAKHRLRELTQPIDSTLTRGR